jgi:hypothetical protein
MPGKERRLLQRAKVDSPEFQLNLTWNWSGEELEFSGESFGMASAK